MQHGMVVAGHLGGYIPGGDEATWFPDMWDWIVPTLGIRSVVDVGCGDGRAVDHFHTLGTRVTGVDGIPQDHPLIETHDFTTGPWPTDDREWDLAWCCEFVEHVEERYVDNFLATFARCRWVLMTHALPGQAGWHHVNCQPRAYWIDRMQAIGFRTAAIQAALDRHAARNTSPWNHWTRSGIAFVRKG